MTPRHSQNSSGSLATERYRRISVPPERLSVPIYVVGVIQETGQVLLQAELRVADQSRAELSKLFVLWFWEQACFADVTRPRPVGRTLQESGLPETGPLHRNNVGAGR